MNVSFKELKSQTLKLNSEFDFISDMEINTNLITKKYFENISTKANTLLTEILLSLVEHKKLSESDEFMSIDDVEKKSKEFILLIKYGDSINNHLIDYGLETEWDSFKLKMGV